MNNECKSLLLFLLGCIPTRLFITYIAKTQLQLLKYMSIPALAISIGFALIYIFKWRRTGGEVFGRKIWWDALRPIHSLLWALFAYMAFIGNKEAWKILFIDTMFGLFSFIVFHISVGSFTKC